jgi:hypothetical protein
MSGGFENQDAAVFQMDFRCFPCLALVESFGIGIGWIPGPVEPVEVGFVVGDPLLDRLPGWFDRLHGLDVEEQLEWHLRVASLGVGLLVGIMSLVSMVKKMRGR